MNVKDYVEKFNFIYQPDKGCFNCTHIERDYGDDSCKHPLMDGFDNGELSVSGANICDNWKGTA